MKPLGSNGWSEGRHGGGSGWHSDWTGDGTPDPRDRSPIEDPEWPYLNPTTPRNPHRMAEDGSDIEPPRSPKKVWSERPPKSPKDVSESDRPRSPKSPRRGFGRTGEGSGDFC